MSSSETQTKILSDALYECVRCGTRTKAEELAKLAEARCICGYSVFRKTRPSIARQLKAI